MRGDGGDEPSSRSPNHGPRSGAAQPSRPGVRRNRTGHGQPHVQHLQFVRGCGGLGVDVVGGGERSVHVRAGSSGHAATGAHEHLVQPRALGRDR